MKVSKTTLPEVLLLEPKGISGTPAAFFLESYNEKTMKEEAGVAEKFVQDNLIHSLSTTSCCGGCTIKCARKANWSGWWWERFSM